MTVIFNKVATKIFGSANERLLKRLWPIVGEINALEPEMQRLSDDELRARTDKFREQVARCVAEAEISGTTQEEQKKALRDATDKCLDDILVEAFAVVREASRRSTGMRHFDVQLIGGMVLHRGTIAEMKTGEGKTLVATLPAYLNAIANRGVHVVTVNDYLAKRDSEWMGQIYRFLGLTVGCIQHHLSDLERRAAYACDVTYGTNNELGFDYLRDNMKYSMEEMVHREFNYAIVDEVDSILIDEARTPLIISGPSQDRTDLYERVDKIIPLLKPEHYEKDEKQRSITFTDAGTEYAEKLLVDHGILTSGGLYDLHNVSLVHHLNQALRAHHMFKRDVDYLVKDNRVHLIDEFTGRIMEGRRLSEGL